MKNSFGHWFAKALCWLGLHKWREEVVLRQTFEETGSVVYYDDDVCQWCHALRDPEGVADAYAVMANMRGTIEIHPDKIDPPSNSRADG
jgi:hypothetical protein